MIGKLRTPRRDAALASTPAIRRPGLIKRVASAYRSYLTCLGRVAIAAAYCVTERHIVPALARAR